MSEKMVSGVDTKIRSRVAKIFLEKERHAYEMKKRAEASRRRVVGDAEADVAMPDVEPGAAAAMPPADTQVVGNAGSIASCICIMPRLTTIRHCTAVCLWSHNHLATCD